ncbi:MAG: hypothetical protein ACM34O_16035 [Ignavibacteria bacterium]
MDKIISNRSFYILGFWYYCEEVSIALMLLFFFFTPGCDTAEPPDEENIPAINYVLSGGFTGGIRTKLNINPDGEALLESNYPPLKLQLSKNEHADLLRSFRGFGEFPEEFQNSCIDGLIFTIKLETASYSKQVAIDQCTLMHQESDPIIAQIDNIIGELNLLAKKIYDTQAPWKGLTAEFSIESDIYGLDEPISLHYKITNPTSQQRALYFRNPDQFWFRLYKENFPGFSYFYSCPLNYGDSNAESQILLEPGETKENTIVWDQHIHTDETDSAAGIGYFILNMNIFNSEFETKYYRFEIVDRNIPISGYLIPDINGEADPTTYIFNLSVRNWQTYPVTLHFSSKQLISVKLYDSDKPIPGPLIYASPSETDSSQSSITLPPGEVRNFTHAANKSDFKSWYMWTYCVIRLNCTDFEFIRDGQLRIFNNSSE